MHPLRDPAEAQQQAAYALLAMAIGDVLRRTRQEEPTCTGVRVFAAARLDLLEIDVYLVDDGGNHIAGFSL